MAQASVVVATKAVGALEEVLAAERSRAARVGEAGEHGLQVARPQVRCLTPPLKRRKSAALLGAPPLQREAGSDVVQRASDPSHL